MNILPLHDRVVVRRVEEEKTTSSGIIIPDSATEKPSRGEVIAVGNGRKNDNGEVIAMDVKLVIRFYLVNMQVMRSKLMVKPC